MTTESAKHETVLDTGAEQLGKTYARALIGAAENAGVTQSVVGQLGQIVDEYLAGSPPLAAAFASPRVSSEEKVRVVEKVFGGDFEPVLVTFLKVMAGRERLGNIGAVRRAADALVDEMTGRVLAEVRTAVPLDDTMRTQITQQLGSVFNKEVRLSELVDPELIGGMVVRVGDTVFDNSVANRLQKMSRRARDGFSTKLMEKFDQLTSE